MGVFMGLWIAQIVFGAIIFFAVPKQASDGEKAERMRNGAIFAGILPCVGFMLLFQIVCLLMYFGIRGRETRMHQQLQGGLQTSFGPPATRPAPAIDVQQEPQAQSKPASDNPFL